MSKFDFTCPFLLATVATHTRPLCPGSHPNHLPVLLAMVATHTRPFCPGPHPCRLPVPTAMGATHIHLCRSDQKKKNHWITNNLLSCLSWHWHPLNQNRPQPTWKVPSFPCDIVLMFLDLCLMTRMTNPHYRRQDLRSLPCLSLQVISQLIHPIPYILLAFVALSCDGRKWADSWKWVTV